MPAKKKTAKGPKPVKTDLIRVSSRKRAPIPIRPAATADDRKARALERLGVEAEAIVTEPKVSITIEKGLPGGIDAAIEFLRGSADPDAVKWIKTYDSVSQTDSKLIPFEAFCLAAGMSAIRVGQLIFAAVVEQSNMAAEMLAAASHPIVVANTIRNSDHPLGSADRKMLLQHNGFLPMPKTQILAPKGNMTIDQSNNSHNTQNATIAIGDLASIQPKMNQITDRFNEARGAKVSAQPIQELLLGDESEDEE